MLGADTPAPAVLQPASRTAFPAAAAPEAQNLNAIEKPLTIAEPASAKGGFGKTVGRFFMFLLFLVAVGAAFYGGRKYKGPVPYLDQSEQPIAAVDPAATAPEDSLLRFERARRSVDSDPNEWLSNQLKSELSRQSIQNPLQSTDAEFLYLYGRACLLSGNIEEAGKAFEATIADSNTSPASATLRREAVLGLAAVALKSDKDRARAQRRFDEIVRKPAPASPVSSPAGSPLGSP
jgi:tetratricopeptide (TPR) repeat protein